MTPSSSHRPVSHSILSKDFGVKNQKSYFRGEGERNGNRGHIVTKPKGSNFQKYIDMGSNQNNNTEQQENIEGYQRNHSAKLSSKHRNKKSNKQLMFFNSKKRHSVTESSKSQREQFGADLWAEKTAKYSNQSKFIGNIDSYLGELKRTKLNLNMQNLTVPIKNSGRENLNPNTNPSSNLTNAKLQKKILKEKSINRNLQKCIIQIQQVLWERNDKLEMLQDKIQRKTIFNDTKQMDFSKYKKGVDREGHYEKTLIRGGGYESKKKQSKKNKSEPKFNRKKQFLLNDKLMVPERGEQSFGNSTINDLSKISGLSKTQNIRFNHYRDQEGDSGHSNIQRASEQNWNSSSISFKDRGSEHQSQFFKEIQRAKQPNSRLNKKRGSADTKIRYKTSRNNLQF